MKRDYIFTLVTALITVVSALSLYKMSIYLFGTLGFAEFSLIKRVIAFLVPLFALGLGVGLPREVARVNGTENDAQKYFILKYALLIILAPTIVSFILISMFSGKIALLIFSDASYFYLLLPMGIFMFGSLLTALAYSYFRGLDRIVVSNLLQVINMALVPIIVMAFFSDDVSSFFSTSGIIIAVISLGFLWSQLRKNYGGSNLEILRRLFSYSIRRVPGDISLQLLFVIPAILTAHVAGVEEAGKVSFGLAVLTMASTPLSPLSVLLLPKSMKLFIQGNLDDLKRMVNSMLKYTLVAYFVVSLSLFVGAEFVVNIFFGIDKLTSFVIKGIAIATMPYSVYILLRSIVDAGSRRAYNSYNCFITVLLFLVVSQLGAKYMDVITSMIFAIVFAFYLLGILTYLRARTIGMPRPYI